MTPAVLYKGIQKQDSRSLARAITLIESTLPTDRILAQELLSLIGEDQERKAIRIGISGIPGVGKSTFIEALGKHILNLGQKKRIAVLSIDPTSPIVGGSILADRIRMTSISNHPDVFIRPSPTQGAHGGLSRRTLETLFLLDAANFDYIFVETVGVGQTEFYVASLVDVFLLLQMPATGDEWQALKKGILELADFIVINKADGDLKKDALQLKKIMEGSSSLNNGNDRKQIALCSARESQGLSELWTKILAFIKDQKSTGNLEKKREAQTSFWFDEELIAQFKSIIASDLHIAKKISTFRSQAVGKNALKMLRTAENTLKEILRTD